MYIVPIAWIYVAMMMAVAEATNTNGTVLGAFVTFVLYGAAPVALVLYFMGSPSRRRQIKAREQAEWEAAQALRASTTKSQAPDAGGQAPAAPEATAAQPMRKEP